MAFLGMDIDRANLLAAGLKSTAERLQPARQLIRQAESLAGLPTNTTPLLDEVAADLGRSAVVIERAAAQLEAHRLSIVGGQPSGFRGVRPAPARWDADPAAAWNEVHQSASHNSYEVDGGVAALYANGVRAFELDLHRGAPTSFTGERRLVGPPLDLLFDHFDHAGGRPDDWRVYHVSGSSSSKYEYLSEGLAAVAALPGNEPLTVFLDLKDALAGSHSAVQLDRVLDDAFGERLFRPADLLGRAPSAETVVDAVAAAGWPRVRELEGRVIVVLTDQTDSYVSARPNAFVAPAPHFRSGADSPIHVPDADAVFYNALAGRLDDDLVAGVQSSGAILRTYGNPQCTRPTFETDGSDERPRANYEAADFTGDDPPCPPPVPRPPEGTPVPVIER